MKESEIVKEVAERKRKHDQYVDALGTLMLGCWRHWKDKSASDFREYLASAHQLAVEAIYRNDAEAKQTITDAEKVIAAYEMRALQESGGRLS